MHGNKTIKKNSENRVKMYKKKQIVLINYILKKYHNSQYPVLTRLG